MSGGARSEHELKTQFVCALIGNAPMKDPQPVNQYLESLLDRGARSFLEDRQSYEEIMEETIFLLKHRLDEMDIAYSAVIGRIKSLESLLKKCRRKGYYAIPLQCDDLAGVRVTCLFAEDVPRISDLIAKGTETGSGFVVVVPPKRRSRRQGRWQRLAQPRGVSSSLHHNHKA